MSSLTVNEDGIEITTCELDTHADTCCFGKHCFVLNQDMNNVAEVTPFLAKLGKLTKVPIKTAAVAYDCPTTYQTFVLMFHESLYIEELESHLICPNQLRHSGIQVNDTPLQYLPERLRNVESHSIIAEGLQIPLQLNGVLSYFNVRRPTNDEINDSVTYPHIDMTNSFPWDPYDQSMTQIERFLAQSLHVDTSGVSDRSVSCITTCLSSISSVYDHDCFYERLIERRALVSSTTSLKKRSLTAEELASKWFIGIETAKRTIERNTQRGVRDFSNTTGTRRLKHTAYQLKFRHLRSSVYTDTMFTSVKSLRQNTCAQVYITSFHWTKVYPMKAKGDAHMTLDRVFRDVGVFHTIIPDNAKELTEGDFRRKALHAGAQIKPVEAYTHNQNLAESGIRELRRMYRKAMLSTNAPHVLWDYCMELMADIRSHLALSLLELEGDTPQTVLTGDTSDMSNICEFQWYELVWFIDPLDKLENKKLARYLGPSHDVGQAMSSRLLTSKAQEISRTSVIPLSIEEKNNPAIQEKISQYTATLTESLGDRINGIPIEEEDEIPQYEVYGDDDKGDEPTIKTNYSAISLLQFVNIASNLSNSDCARSRMAEESGLLKQPPRSRGAWGAFSCVTAGIRDPGAYTSCNGNSGSSNVSFPGMGINFRFCTKGDRNTTST